MIRRPPRSPLFPYTPLFRPLLTFASRLEHGANPLDLHHEHLRHSDQKLAELKKRLRAADARELEDRLSLVRRYIHFREDGDRKSTRLNSSHSQISYAVFCLK